MSQENRFAVSALVASIKTMPQQTIKFLNRPVQIKVVVILAFVGCAVLATEGSYNQGMQYADYLAANKLYPATPHYPGLSFDVFRSGDFVSYDCQQGGTLEYSNGNQPRPTGFCHKP